MSGRGQGFCLRLYDRDIEDSDKLPLERGGGGATERNTQPPASKDSFWNNEESTGAEKERKPRAADRRLKPERRGRETKWWSERKSSGRLDFRETHTMGWGLNSTARPSTDLRVAVACSLLHQKRAP